MEVSCAGKRPAGKENVFLDTSSAAELLFYLEFVAAALKKAALRCPTKHRDLPLVQKQKLRVVNR